MSEQSDLRQAVIEAMQLFRDNYQPVPDPWVLPPDVYDEAERQIAAGTAAPVTIAVMRNAVRAETWTEEPR